MKNAFALILLLTCFVGRLMGANITNFPGFLMGSEERVMEHCLKSGRAIDIYLSQQLPDGQTLYFKGFIKNYSPKTKADLDRVLRESLLVSARNILTNNIGQDWSLPFRAASFFTTGDLESGQMIDYLVSDIEFSLVRSGSGYKLPDTLSKVEFGLLLDVAYKVPGLSWARVSDSEESYDSAQADSRVVDLGSKFLFIPNKLATSGTASISMVTGVGSNLRFQVFDGMGNARAEKPGRLGLSISSPAESRSPRLSGAPSETLLTLSLTDGEDGRIYQVQCSDSVTGDWTDIPGLKWGYWQNLPGYFGVTEQTPNKFYRLRPVEGVPIYVK